MTQTQFIPDRGQVIWLSFDPRAGHEQGGRRPALVLSPAAYNGKVGLGLGGVPGSRSAGSRGSQVTVATTHFRYSPSGNAG